MLMSGQQPASNAWLSLLSWDKSTSGAGRYFLEVPAGKTATFSVVLTWHRTITPNANWSVLTPSLADLNLRLSTASAEFAVGALVAESRSPIDNVEHVYQRRHQQHAQLEQRTVGQCRQLCRDRHKRFGLGDQQPSNTHRQRRWRW